MKKIGINNIVWLSLVLVFTGIDQVTKWWARMNFETPRELFPGVELVFTQNTGIAFSLPVPNLVVIPITVMVIGVALHWFLQTTATTRLEKICGFFLVAGALGNLIDRLLLGAVTDWIAIGRFPVFNLADTFVTVAVVILILEDVLQSKKRSR